MQQPANNSTDPAQPAKEQIILPHGGCRKLAAYRKSETIFLGTRMFCERFLPKFGDQTVDQMVQAARSCVTFRYASSARLSGSSPGCWCGKRMISSIWAAYESA